MTEAEAGWWIADQVRTGNLKARDVIESALGRIARGNPALNAFTAVDEAGALREAGRLDAAVARGEDPGVLAGVPFGVKDLEEAAGLPLTMGSRVFRDQVGVEDSIQVARLKAAGAIVVGKTNTPEFGYKGWTDNLLYGPTRNPWNLEKTPGGSSGGSAAAVTAGLVPMCTGSDGGGSIRIPAAMSGCFGLKPSCGRIPRGGMTASHWAFLSHRGPLSWTVRDAARYLDVAAGPHADDMEALDGPSGHYEASLVRLPRLRRVAFSEDLGYAAVEPAVRRLAREAAVALAAAVGAELVDANPGFDDPFFFWGVVAASGDAAMHATWTGEQKALADPGYLKFGEVGLGFSSIDYANAMQERHRLNWLLSRLFEEHDLLLTPTLPVTAFKAEGPPPRMIDGRIVPPNAYIPFTFPFNITGHPAGSVPAGLAPDGLPVGLQIVGPRFRDELVLQVSAAYEAVRPWSRPG